MSRLTYIRIAGKNYPMSFSLGASKKLIEKFGGVERIQTELSKPGKDLEKLDLIYVCAFAADLSGMRIQELF